MASVEAEVHRVSDLYYLVCLVVTLVYGSTTRKVRQSSKSEALLAMMH